MSKLYLLYCEPKKEIIMCIHWKTKTFGDKEKPDPTVAEKMFLRLPFFQSSSMRSFWDSTEIFNRTDANESDKEIIKRFNDKRQF